MTFVGEPKKSMMIKIENSTHEILKRLAKNSKLTQNAVIQAALVTCNKNAFITELKRKHAEAENKKELINKLGALAPEQLNKLLLLAKT